VAFSPAPFGYRQGHGVRGFVVSGPFGDSAFVFVGAVGHGGHVGQRHGPSRGNAHHNIAQIVGCADERIGFDRHGSVVAVDRARGHAGVGGLNGSGQLQGCEMVFGQRVRIKVDPELPPTPPDNVRGGNARHRADFFPQRRRDSAQGLSLGNTAFPGRRFVALC
jgi:hypothetical protein